MCGYTIRASASANIKAYELLSATTDDN